MSLISSVLGSAIGHILGDRVYWAVKMHNGTWQSELDSRVDTRYPGCVRPFDWTLDLVATGDVRKIQELWLFCPPNRLSPMGNTACLKMTEPGTAFQFKTRSMDMLGADANTFEGQIIGRVDSKETGDCTFFVWDNVLRAMSTPRSGNVYTGLPSWRDGIADTGPLALDALGLRLG